MQPLVKALDPCPATEEQERVATGFIISNVQRNAFAARAQSEKAVGGAGKAG